MSAALGWVVLTCWALGSALSVFYYFADEWVDRPTPYRIVMLPLEVAVVWLALRAVGV